MGWHIEIRSTVERELTDAELDELVDRLAPHHSAVAVGQNGLNVSLTVDGIDLLDSLGRAHEAVKAELERLGCGPAAPLTVSAIEEGEFEAELSASSLPKLAGVAEIAAALGVSRQRVSELSRRPNFPKPIVQLAAGPVWLESSIRAFAENWIRKPGRAGPAERQQSSS